MRVYLFILIERFSAILERFQSRCYPHGFFFFFFTFYNNKKGCEDSGGSSVKQGRCSCEISGGGKEKRRDRWRWRWRSDKYVLFVAISLVSAEEFFWFFFLPPCVVCITSFLHPGVKAQEQKRKERKSGLRGVKGRE